MDGTRFRTVFTVSDYDLAGTLNSGQAFRWRESNGVWEGIIGQRWVRLQQDEQRITAVTAEAVESWDWLAHYLQVGVNLAAILSSFPNDPVLRAAVESCRGLRLLRQDPWECLASFILSSTKQIVQIRQIVGLVCQNSGNPVLAPNGPEYSFPSAERLAQCTEAELRACKMGFRAPYLCRTAALIASGEVNLNQLATLSLTAARDELLKLPGVGRKIADCVLLFAYGFPKAFPVDVWVMKALRQLYFRGRKAKLKRLQEFSQLHFGPQAGYAQQYLFHYMRTRRTTVPQRSTFP